MRIAVLVDGENAESALLPSALEEVGRFGTVSGTITFASVSQYSPFYLSSVEQVTVQRAYGDWGNSGMSRWKSVLKELAVRPMQASAYCTGKSSTDTELIMDAMEMLHSPVVDGICIVSSDSDFRGLALRYREQGKVVIGVGKMTTPTALQRACDRFIYTDGLVKSTCVEAPAVRAVALARASRALKFAAVKPVVTMKPVVTVPAVKPVVKTSKSLRAVTALARSRRPIETRAVTVRSIEPPLMRLIEQVLREAKTTHRNGLIPHGLNIGELNIGLLKLDPSFSHKEYGGLRAFCSNLAPQYMIKAVGSAYYISVRELPTKPKAQGVIGSKTCEGDKAVAGMPTAVARSIEPLLMRFIDQAFQAASSTPHGVTHGVEIGDLKKRLTILDPSFNHTEYVNGGFRAFCEKLALQYTMGYVANTKGYCLRRGGLSTEPTAGGDVDSTTGEDTGVVGTPTIANRSIEPAIAEKVD
jgi:hypothetical protein